MTAAVLSWVFIGGALGSLARELLAPLSPFEQPWVATLIINVAASFMIGCVYAAQNRLHHHIRSFAAVGFCGGFSTFSTFAHEIVDLMTFGAWLEAMIYVIASIVLGLFAAVAGEALVAKLVRMQT